MTCLHGKVVRSSNGTSKRRGLRRADTASRAQLRTDSTPQPKRLLATLDDSDDLSHAIWELEVTSSAHRPLLCICVRESTIPLATTHTRTHCATMLSRFANADVGTIDRGISIL